MKKALSVILAAALSSSAITIAPSAEEPEITDFVIANAGGAADIYVDPDGTEYDGLSIIADAFAGDILSVTGQTAEVVTDLGELSGTPIIAGALGENDGGIIDKLAEEGKINTEGIEGKWETYTISIVDAPTENIEKALVIAGSDKRGTMYGIFHISEMMGVSPWINFGDVKPEHQDSVSFSEAELTITSKEPSVKYRGVFLNDEAPSLTGWTKNKFGDVNYLFYEQLYEVLIRLKANYLWPAMWSEVFSKDGISGISDPGDMTSLANAELADAYGIVMGTSHHEPMCRAGNEWGQDYAQYLNDDDVSLGSKATWDYFNYDYAIREFWRDGYTRNAPFENLVTIGMRGESDSSLGLSLTDSVLNLKNVITDQLDIINEYSAENNTETAPTTLCLYKEVEEYWYGGTDPESGEYVPGLNAWCSEDGSGPLENTNIMLCDDNFGNVRTLPRPEERDRAGGWGMYYHFDYVGVAHNYKWIGTHQLEKTYENMKTAYDYGVRNVWVVNVGDFKPLELNISYFLDLAYDIDTYGDPDSPGEYYRSWEELYKRVYC